MTCRLAFPLTLLFVLATVGCGGQSTKVPADAIAVIGNHPITKARFEQVLTRAKTRYKRQHQPFPKVGTTQYEQIKQQVVQLLVQQEELEEKAKELGVKVSDKQVESRLAQYRRQFGGEKGLEAQAKANGMTIDAVRTDVIRPQLLSEGLYKKITGGVKVSDAAVASFYNSHLSLYQQAESRDVRRIVVQTRTLGNKLYDRIKAGASFAKLAHRYSKDLGTAQGGKLTITRGQTPGPFDQTAFLLAKGDVSRPIKTPNGWEIIQAISDVRPAHTIPLNQARKGIRQQLLQQRKGQVLGKWVNETKKEFDKKTHYRAGYAPPASTTSSSTTG